MLLKLSQKIQRKWAVGLLLLSCALAPRSSGQTGGEATVSTIGGAFAGYVDGDNRFSQFSTPWGITLDNSGQNLLIVDRGNKVLRKLRLSDQLVTTQIPALNKPTPLLDPVAVAVDRSNFIYVADQGNGTVGKFDSDANLRAVPVTGLVKPVAIALDARTNLFIAEQGGAVRRVTAAGEQSVVFTVTGAGAVPKLTPQLSGLALLDSGNLVVSDAANHAIWLYTSKSNAVTLLTGGKGAGFTDGPPGFAQFNQPQQIARGPNNALVVADRLNHRVRSVTCDGKVSTVYGIDPTQWFTMAFPGVFPGWEDGNIRFAEARDPIGVAVGGDGVVFSTEIFYHLARRTSGYTFPASSCGGGATNAVSNPVLSPNSGYFPLGVNIEVTSPEDSPFSSETKVYYTTDGSEPTTNSLPVVLTGGKGVITLHDPKLDLLALKVKAFEGTNASLTISGQPVSFTEPGLVGEIGVPVSLNGNTIYAGVGATVVVPVVANMRPGDELRSLQFLVEVIPAGGAPAIVPPLAVRPILMSANDFIPVVASSPGLPTAFTAQVGDTTRLALAYIGTNTVFNVKTFGVVAMLAVPIPIAARAGQSYTLHVSKISGTTDGVQATVPLRAMADRRIEIRNSSYLVGDVSPGYWYNSGDFGAGRLDNADVNAAFFASLGFRVPYQFTDAFDAMDVFPEDNPPNVGGDGKIRFLDWQVILKRSLGLSGNNFSRIWSTNGFRVSSTTAVSPDSSIEPLARMSSNGKVWNKQAWLEGAIIGNLKPGTQARVPVWLRVRGGNVVGGLQFAATVSGPNGASVRPQFIVDGGFANPMYSGVFTLASGAESSYTAWSLGQFPPSTGRSLLGEVVFDLPATGQAGDVWKVGFSNVDGASQDGNTLEFESLHGEVYVGASAPIVADRVSDEWAAAYFGGSQGGDASPGADPDHDGFSNAVEWAAGTEPKQPDWQCRIQDGHFAFRWFAQSGRSYQVQRAARLGSWESVGGVVTGNDALVEFNESSAMEDAQFYRIKTIAP